MRIRKRQVPLPLSSLSPVPLSDPHLINRSPVVVQLNDAASTITTPTSSSAPLVQHASATSASRSDRYQPSDQPLPPIGKTSDGSDDPAGFGIATESGAHRQRHHHKQDPLEEEGRGQGGGEKGNDTRKGSNFGSEMPVEVFPPSSPSSNQAMADGRWCEGEKVIPLKKRRGNFENATTENNTYQNSNNKKLKTRMKTKMNKKCSDNKEEEEEEDGDDVEEEGQETKPAHDVNVSNNNNNNKKRARGSALMEGSRCSRVNGRGWRCCQQTLVGYSLCEHHLGKGRLRSMTSVRSRSISTAPTKVPDPLSMASSSSSPEKQTKCTVTDDSLGNDDDDDDDEKKPLIITKKRMKLGMVKARSISSLLGQTKTEIGVAHENDTK